MEVVFMPWAGPLDLRPRGQPDAPNTITLGPVTVRPFSLIEQDQTVDRSVVDHLKALLERYVHVDGTPVRDVFVLSHGVLDFRDLNPTEINDVILVADALVFSTIYPVLLAVSSGRQPLSGPPAPEVFKLTWLKFTPGIEHIAIHSGNAVNVWGSFKKVTFQEPWFVTRHRLTPDLDLLDAIGHLWDTPIPVTDRERIIRSLEWFRIAHSGADSVLPASRVVMMSTAFEILLGIDDSSRPAFADGLKRLIPTDEMERAPRSKKGEKKPLKQRDLSLLECWGWDFYVLRSEIVHGDLVGPQNILSGIDGIDHLTIAAAVFGEVLIRDLYRLGCFDSDARQRAEKLVEAGGFGRTVEEWTAYMTDNDFGFRALHKHLGWRRAPDQGSKEDR